MRNFMRRGAVVAVAVPLAAAGARRLGYMMESRRGASRTSNLLQQAADTMRRMTGQPARRRRRWR